MAKEITVEFQTSDKELDDLILMEFEKEKIQYSNQFTAEGLISIILSATKESIGKVITFFKRHQESFRTAILKTSEGIRFSLFEYPEMELLLTAVPVNSGR